MTTSRRAFESPFKTMTAYVAGHCRSDRQTCPLVRVYTQYNTASIRLSTDMTEVIAANAIFLRIQADSRLSRCGTYTKYLMYKSGRQRLAAEQRNFLFFCCPPDGVRFRMPVGLFAVFFQISLANGEKRGILSAVTFV